MSQPSVVEENESLKERVKMLERKHVLLQYRVTAQVENILDQNAAASISISEMEALISSLNDDIRRISERVKCFLCKWPLVRLADCFVFL